MTDYEDIPDRSPPPLTDAELDRILQPSDPLPFDHGAADAAENVTPDPAEGQPLQVTKDALEAVELDVEGLYHALGNTTVRELLMLRLDRRQRLTLAKAAIAGYPSMEVPRANRGPLRLSGKGVVRALSLMAEEIGFSARDLREKCHFEMANQAELRAGILQLVIVKLIELCVESERREIVAVINGKREWDEGEDEDIKPMRYAR